MQAKSDGSKFRDAVAALFASFGQEATEAIYTGYWLGLNDLTIEQLQGAVARAIRDCRFVPKPVELRELVFGKADDRAVLAWGDFLRAVGLGPYKHINFEDRLINATVRNLGGWPQLISRLTDAESEKWVRQEFIKAYKSFQASGVSGEICLPLPGLSECSFLGGERVAPIPRLVACSSSRLGIGEQKGKARQDDLQRISSNVALAIRAE